MTDQVEPNPEKDPSDWTTGDEPMTGPQKSYLHTLAQQAGEEAPPDDLSKADASKAIEVLGWQPVVGLEEGLKRTIAWYQQHLTPRT